MSKKITVIESKDKEQYLIEESTEYQRKKVKVPTKDLPNIDKLILKKQQSGDN